MGGSTRVGLMSEIRISLGEPPMESWEHKCHKSFSIHISLTVSPAEIHSNALAILAASSQGPE